MSKKKEPMYEQRYELWVWALGAQDWVRFAPIRQALGKFAIEHPEAWEFWPEHSSGEKLMVMKANIVGFRIVEVPTLRVGGESR
jgi:hypothetical protein